MPGASVFFYGRRSRSSRAFDDLAASPSSSSSSSSSSSDATTTTHRRRNTTDPHHHRRHRLTNPDATPSQLRSHASHHTVLSSLSETEHQQRRCVSDLLSQGVNQETVQHLSRRCTRNKRLPGPVLLAKERLLERLRGVSVSGGRQRQERSPSLHCEDFWVVDADWETTVFREQPTLDAILNETRAAVPPLSTPEEPNKKPMGLTIESLSQLHHEIFQEHQIDKGHLESEASTECCICLENFTEGNKLMGLPCGHRFHTSCLYPWLRTCGECPYCRSCILPPA